MRNSKRNMFFSAAILTAIPQLAVGGTTFTPATIRQAYGFSALSGTGVGQTLALVEVGTSSSLQSDLNQFDAQYGLPATTLSVVNESGATVSAATTAQAQAAALDIEYAHAIAPGANIIVVDSAASLTDELESAQYAGTQASVVSINAAYSETSTSASIANTYLNSTSTVFVAPTGAHGSPASAPSVSPLVLGIGGTSLTTSSNGTYQSETGSSASGGGVSQYQGTPSFQSNNGVNYGARSTPDVSYNDGDADPYSYVYDGSTFTGSGTSVGAAQWAALITLVDEAIKDAGGSTLSTSQVENALYNIYNSSSYSIDFHDITSGNGAGLGYDLATGIGSPIANQLVRALAQGDPIPNDPQPLTAVPAPNAFAGGLLGIAGLALVTKRRRA